MQRKMAISALAAFLCFGGIAHAQSEIIQKYSKQHGLNPALVQAIAMQESALNPLIINIEGKSHCSKQ